MRAYGTLGSATGTAARPRGPSPAPQVTHQDLAPDDTQSPPLGHPKALKSFRK